MSGLAGLGAIAGGFAQGLERGQRIRANNMWLERQRRLDEEEAKFNTDLQAANAEAREWLQNQTTQTIATPGTELPAGQDGQEGLAPMPQAQQQRTQPSQAQLLRAARLRTNKLFELGHTDRAMKIWLQDEQVRGSLRESAAQKLQAALSTGGDVTPAAREFYDTIDDGMDLVSMTPRRQSTDEGGGMVYEIVTRDNKGRETLSQATPDEILMQLNDAMADRKQTALASIRNKYELGQINARAAEDRATAEKKHGLTMKEIEARGDESQETQRLKGLSAETVARIRAGETVTASQIRKAGGGKGGTGNNVARTVTNADGTRTLIFRDGSSRMLVDDSGKPLIGVEAERLLQSLTGLIGKTIEGSLATPEANRERARQMQPKPPAGLPAGIPAGSKQVGTSGGKPVFEAPNGKRYVVD